MHMFASVSMCVSICVCRDTVFPRIFTSYTMCGVVFFPAFFLQCCTYFTIDSMLVSSECLCQANEAHQMNANEWFSNSPIDIFLYTIFHSNLIFCETIHKKFEPPTSSASHNTEKTLPMISVQS